MSASVTILVKLNQNLNILKLSLLFLNYFLILLIKFVYFMYLTFKYLILFPFRVFRLILNVLIYLIFWIISIPAFIITKIGDGFGVMLFLCGLTIVFFNFLDSSFSSIIKIEYSIFYFLSGYLIYKLAEFIESYNDKLLKLILNLKARINNSFLKLFKFLSKKEMINISNLILWYLQRFLVSINKIYSESTIHLITEQEYLNKISSNTFYDKKLSKIIVLHGSFEKLNSYNREVFLFAKNKIDIHYYFDYFKFNSKSNAFMFTIRLI